MSAVWAAGSTLQVDRQTPKTPEKLHQTLPRVLTQALTVTPVQTLLPFICD